MDATIFSMIMSGEAGLSKGKKFNVKFLMKSEPVSRKLLTDDMLLFEGKVIENKKIQLFNFIF